MIGQDPVPRVSGTQCWCMVFSRRQTGTYLTNLPCPVARGVSRYEVQTHVPPRRIARRYPFFSSTFIFPTGSIPPHRYPPPSKSSHRSRYQTCQTPSETLVLSSSSSCWTELVVVYKRCESNGYLMIDLLEA